MELGVWQAINWVELVGYCFSYNSVYLVFFNRSWEVGTLLMISFCRTANATSAPLQDQGQVTLFTYKHNTKTLYGAGWYDWQNDHNARVNPQ